MKRILPVFLFAALLAPAARSQMVTGRLVTSFYGWERQDSIGSATQHMRGYENVQLDAAVGAFSFHTSMQGSTDLQSAMENDPQLRLFNAFLYAKNLGGMADVKLGRQAVFAGVSYGSIDGALVRVRPADGVEVTGYAGGLTPPSQKADFFQNLDKNWQAGGQVLLFLVPNVKLGLSYMNRHRESTPFQSFRPDAQLGLIPTTIDYGSRANQYGSLQATYGKSDLWVSGRFDYDFNFSRASRIELSGMYEPTPKINLYLNLAHRDQTIAYNSYFALLEAEANQEATVGLDYKLHPLATVVGRFSTVLYDNDNAIRVSLGAMNKYASVMYTKDVSYDGKLDGFNGHFTYPLLEGMLVPHIGAMYSTYALADGLDRAATWAGTAGAMFRPWKMLSFDAEGQYLTNKIYKSDLRVFARINYWFSHGK